MKIKQLILVGAGILFLGASTGWCATSLTDIGQEAKEKALQAAKAQAQANAAEKAARAPLTACYKQRTDWLYPGRNDKSPWKSSSWVNRSNSHVVNSPATCYTQCYNVWNVLNDPQASITSTQFKDGQTVCNACSNSTINDPSTATGVPGFSLCNGLP